MGRVRPLSRDDIPEVGDLFIQVFRQGARPSRERVLEYFEQVYFENPYTTPISLLSSMTTVRAI